MLVVPWSMDPTKVSDRASFAAEAIGRLAVWSGLAMGRAGSKLEGAVGLARVRRAEAVTVVLE